MQWLQTILDNGTTPVLTACILGLLTALSPCPLATNIAAIGYIGKHVDTPRRAFLSGMLYAAGRVLSYGVLGAVLISVLRAGESVFQIQRLLSGKGGMAAGVVLILVGLFMLTSGRLNLKGFGYSGNDGQRLATKGAWGALLLGMLFALAFCPTSAVFYFGMLIPMSAHVTYGYLLPAVFALATTLPVLVVAWILAFSVGSISRFYHTTAVVQRWLNRIVAVLFIGIGIYYIVGNCI
ncbi:MAG: aromatic aminobenezylarsenical efflux permease ArsG family transporter [Paludibacteraceae bacterium]